jgi:hypothetical protein
MLANIGQRPFFDAGPTRRPEDKTWLSLQGTLAARCVNPKQPRKTADAEVIVGYLIGLQSKF